MALPTTEKNAIVDFAVGRGDWYSLHTADPGTTGASEATGGSPAYARKQSTFGAAASGTTTGSQVTFDLLGQATHWGRWSASSAGTFRNGGALSATQGIAATQTQVKLTPTINHA
jgi:hypothetical protein